MNPHEWLEVKDKMVHMELHSKSKRQENGLNNKVEVNVMLLIPSLPKY